MCESGHYVEEKMKCKCGCEFLVHWRPRRIIVGHYFARCPNCHASHDTPDAPFRVLLLYA